MAKPFGVWGIDIGQCAVKALRLEVLDGKPTATAFDYIEHPKILSQPDADPEALIRESLEKFLGRNPIGKDQVAVSIAGQSGLVRFVKLPPVEEKKVPDIVKFEARQQIPFPLEEVVWDYQKIGGGETVGGFAMETEVGLFAMKRDVIAKNLAYYQGTKTEVHTVQMTPLALVNFATYELLKKGGPDGVEGDVAAAGDDDLPRGKKRCAVVLDIGTDNSNLIITDGAKIIWQRTVNVGGSHFTKSLTKEMKLTFAKAEHLKRNAAKSPELALILKALRPVLTEFVGEVQRSLGFFTNTHRDAHVAYLVGLGSAFKLPGLQKYLSEKLALEVRKPARFDRLAGDTVLADPTFTDNLLTFPVAYGLALQGIGLARLQTNLLPNEVRVDRLIRAKKPAVAAAAAALLMGTGLLSVGFGQQLGAVEDQAIKKGIETGKSAITQAKNQDDEFSKNATEVKAGQDAVKAIVVGNDERLNWIRMQEVLAAVLPRPGIIDPKTGQLANTPNLTEVVKGPDGNVLYSQETFWRNADAQRAIELYQKRLSQGVPALEIANDDKAEDLPTVNIEAVYCRYVDNIGTFLTAADAFALGRAYDDIADSMLESEVEDDTAGAKRKKPKAVEGGGWVFELRGFTYHKDPTFVKRSLLRNLQRYDKLAPPVVTDQAGVNKITAIIPGAVDPVLPEPGETKKERLSHAFLLLNQPDQNPSPAPNAFRHIGTSLVDALLGGGTGGMSGLGGAGGPGGPGGAGSPGGGDSRLSGSSGSPSTGSTEGGAAAPAAAPWIPLLPGGAAGGSSLGGPGSSGGPGGSGRSMSGGSSDSRSLTPGGATMPTPGATGATGAAKGPKGKTRREFVVCFVWREPTPTDPTPTAGQ